MQELPDLSQLSHSEKDELIRLWWSMLQSQTKQKWSDEFEQYDKWKPRRY